MALFPLSLSLRADTSLLEFWLAAEADSDGEGGADMIDSALGDLQEARRLVNSADRQVCR